MFSGATGPGLEQKSAGPAVVELSADAEYVFKCLLAAHLVMPLFELISD